MTRLFEAKVAVRGEEPLLIGLSGPPGGGKTYSALRLAMGMRKLRGGDVIVIDTEGGRARNYADVFGFLHVKFDPPHSSEAFDEALKQQIARKPACIIIDSISDEHEGEGGYLDLHDEMVPKMGGNEWAAWARPKAARKRLMRTLRSPVVPVILTFRAREKTKQDGKKVVNIGWMPVAPLEIVHGVDLMCVLPPRADGVPVWSSKMIGEDFIIKLPSFLKPCIAAGELNEQTGYALAQWARGDKASSAQQPSPASAAGPAVDASPPAGPVDEGSSDHVLVHDKKLADAAEHGMARLRQAWDDVPPSVSPSLKAALERRHKPRALAVDKAAQSMATEKL